MKIEHIIKRGGEGYQSYKRNLKVAKKAIEALCDLTEEMEDEYGSSDRDESDDDDDEMLRSRKKSRSRERYY